MNTYTVRFAYQEEDSAIEIKAFDAEFAAIDFADNAQSNCDMWEYDNDEWTGDYSVVVTASDGAITHWNLFRDYSVDFSAREIETAPSADGAENV